ncbi:hypothetical protein DERP_003058 [Dermatophagoides pteronyssinus]|uniref:Uncharacterized protein n=1 Tax=Dermatophagoides pteronyssinus TaxID=6956 RepID=A0ABQ8JIG0_DERPT|nr:hypothetical protein DERP_003058 [Dermatophagoides pteronyssinus]
MDTKPIKFDKSNEYINCGIEHKMFVISIVDNNLHQFENCTKISYNNIDEHFVLEKNLFILNNGYRYEFQQIQSSINQTFCLSSTESDDDEISSYSMIRLNKTDHKYHNILLYFVTKFGQNSIKYLIHNFKLQSNNQLIRQHNNAKIRYIMVNFNNQHLIIHNDYYYPKDGENSNDEMYKNQFQLIKDPFIYKNDKKPLEMDL